MLTAAVFLFVSWPLANAAAFESDTGGHVKIQDTYTDDKDQSVMTFLGGERRWDGTLDFRLANTLSFGDSLGLETHYDLTGTTGDSYSGVRKAVNTVPFIQEEWLGGYGSSDRRRLFDLTSTISENSDGFVQHRIDRLVLSVKRPDYEIRLGRQAVTWGNGLIFNPMDMMNPFSPTDTVRDYKTGDDLALVSVEPPGGNWNVQAVLVPRRDPVTGDVEEEQSSLAAKLHLMAADMETDVLFGRHMDETIAGFGVSRNAGEAVFRFDLVYTTLRNGWGESRNAFSFVANLDRSWVFLGRNMYGLVEYHHNGLGHRSMENAITDPDLLERAARGEIYVLGRNYLGTQIRIELHPLVQATFGLIESLDALTGVAQPRVQVDMTQNSNLLFGCNLLYGKRGTEFGGIEIPGTGYLISQGSSVYLILGYYF